MERFEIALSLNDKELLIPSMLPKEKPGMQLHRLQKLLRKKSDEKVWHEFQRTIGPSVVGNYVKSELFTVNSRLADTSQLRTPH